jgi:hypothetical protein
MHEDIEDNKKGCFLGKENNAPLKLITYTPSKQKNIITFGELGVGRQFRVKEYIQYYNKGNDCDCCENQYLCGRDGDALGCLCFDENRECEFIERPES